MHEQIAALKVAARYTAAHTEVPSTDDGITLDEQLIMSRDQLRAEVEARLGPIDALDVYPSGQTSARWLATMGSGRTYIGTIEMRIQWVGETLVVVPQVEVVGDLGTRMAVDVPRQLLRQRMRSVGDRLRRIMVMVRTQPQAPALSLSEDLTALRAIVESAEQSD